MRWWHSLRNIIFFIMLLAEWLFILRAPGYRPSQIWWKEVSHQMRLRHTGTGCFGLCCAGVDSKSYHQINYVQILCIWTIWDRIKSGTAVSTKLYSQMQHPCRMLMLQCWTLKIEIYKMQLISDTGIACDRGNAICIIQMWCDNCSMFSA